MSLLEISNRQKLWLTSRVRAPLWPTAHPGYVLLLQWNPPLPEHLKYFACGPSPSLPVRTTHRADPLQPSGWKTFPIPPPPTPLYLSPHLTFTHSTEVLPTFLLSLPGVKGFSAAMFFCLCLEEQHKELRKQNQGYCLNSAFPVMRQLLQCANACILKLYFN